MGERFTLRITGSNAAYATGFVGEPAIVFDNTRIHVSGTKYAKPIDGDGWHGLPDAELFPGESSSVDIEFEATADLPWYSDWYQAEKVAKVFIRANLDQNRFFTLWNVKTLEHEIDN